MRCSKSLLALALTLLLTLFFQTVGAVEDFTIGGDSVVTVQRCLAAQKNITITNSGDVQSTYDISVGGPGADFVKFSALSLALSPGQTAALTVFYAIPCDAKEGSYPLDIYFATPNFEKRFSQEVIILPADNIDALVTPASAIIKPCESAAYQIKLKNPLDAGFDEVYTLSVEGFPARLSQTRVVLKPGEESNIILTALPTDCAQHGNFPITLTITALRSRHVETFQLDFTITPTDIPELAPGIKTIKTGYGEAEARLAIKNIGDRITTYALAVEGLDWVDVEPKRLTLAPGESGELVLKLKPLNETPEGLYEVVFSATVETTGITYSKLLAVKLKQPGFFSFWFVAGLVVAIAVIALITVLLILYLTSRKCEGKRAAKDVVRARKAEELRQKRAEQTEKLKALREEAKKVALDELKKEYRLVALKKLVKGKPVPIGKKVWAVVWVAIFLLVVAFVVRFWNVVAPNWSCVLLGVAILAVVWLLTKIVRCRCACGRWNVLLANQRAELLTGWASGLGRLSFKAIKPVENLVVKVSKVKPRFKPAEHVVQTFVIQSNAENVLSPIRCVFKVGKGWLARAGIDKEGVRLVKFTGETWQTVQSRPTHEDKSHVYYLAEQCWLGTYAIVGRRAAAKKPSPRAFVWASLAALIIIAAVVAVLTPIPGHKGIPTQSWWQDSTHALKLGRYFSDPDGDKLTYSASRTEHIKIDVVGDVAYFTPEPGWFGSEQVRFTADDGKGGITTSNTVNLIVRKLPLSYFARTIFNAVMAILVILIVLGVVLSFRRQHAGKRSAKTRP